MANNYASNQELQDRFADDSEILFTTDNVGGLVVDTTTQGVLTEVIGNAEGELNGYLAKRYLVPVDVTGDADLDNSLRSKTLDIAQYHLVSRTDYVSKAMQSLYDRAVVWLEGVAKGDILLPATEAPTTTTSRSSQASWGDNDSSDSSTSERVFSRKTQGRL